MKRVLLPYVLGRSSPIPYLFEGILPHFSNRYHFRTFASDEVAVPEHVTVTQVSNSSKLTTALKYGFVSLKSHNLVHTGAFERHRHFVRLASLRNRNISHIHSFRVDVDPKGSYNTKVRRELSRKADVTTAVSEHTAETVREHFGIDPIVIYNAVDSEWFRPGYDRPELFDELGIEGPVFLFVGSLEARKRPDHLLDVAESVPEATFLLVGDGPMADQLRERSNELNNVILPGRVEKDRLPAVYANARGLVFPSVREGCPNVVMEAMAAGIPTVGYRATSMPELIEHGERGLLAETDNVTELTGHVRRLLDAEEAAAMGTNARAYVREHHSFEEIGSQYEALYDELLN